MSVNEFCTHKILFEKGKITRQNEWTVCSMQRFISKLLKSSAIALSMWNFSGSLIYLALCHGKFVTCWSHSFRNWRELDRIQCANNVSSAFGIYTSIGIKWSSSCFRRPLTARTISIKIWNVFDNLRRRYFLNNNIIFKIQFFITLKTHFLLNILPYIMKNMCKNIKWDILLGIQLKMNNKIQNYV